MADKIALSNYKAHTIDKEDNSDSLLFLSHEQLSYERRYSGDWKQNCWPFNACHTIDPEEKRKALVKKNGGYRVFLAGLSEYRKKYITDLYFTLVDLDWKYALTIVFLIYLVSFLLFAAFWWMMAYYNGDFENVGNATHEFCLEGVSSFPGVILFSLETQTTIGYGVAYPNAMCGPTIPLMYSQVVLGFLIETLMLGLIVVKIARPKYRANTILFSRYATINQENGQLVLQIRVGDLRKSHLVDATITGMVIRKYTTPEGAYYPLYQFRCDFSANEMGDQVYLLWPIILTHVIDKSSPLYNFKPADLRNEKFELIVYLTGTVESTGETCQARSSYLPKEIMWGYRFERIEEYNRGRRRWQIDFTGFEDVIHCQNISHSARELDERKKVGKSKENEISSGITS